MAALSPASAGEAGGAGMGGSGPLGTGGTAGTGTGGTAGPGATGGGGCGCHVGGDNAGGIGLATLLGAFALLVARPSAHEEEITMRHADIKRTFAGRRLALAVMLAGLAGFVLLGVRGEAQACGGLFCNAPPPDPFAPLPVAQNGENVVFSITKDPAGGAPTLQAHIQILYTGDAAKFSWVVPVDAAPELSTGTDRLFSALATATQPSFQATPATSGVCIPEPNINVTGTGGFPGGTGSAGSTGAGGASGGGVQVSFQGAVGPFDAAVIKSDDSVALRTWLTDNGYIVSDQAVGPIDDTFATTSTSSRSSCSTAWACGQSSPSCSRSRASRRACRCA